MQLFAWGVSDVGRKRDHNEDSFLVRSEYGLFIVADGMGGHQAGERASRMAVSEMESALVGAAAEGALSGDQRSIERTLRGAAERAGIMIFETSRVSAELHGMGTTLTALLLAGDRAFIAHVGDSRCYLFRNGRCLQLTEDHSWVNEQLRAGLLSEADARDSQYKHVITRAVGFERDVQVDAHSLPLELGDCFLLCSDGLSNFVDDTELSAILTANYYRDVPERLIALANGRGGDDNVTVVLVQVANEIAA